MLNEAFGRCHISGRPSACRATATTVKCWQSGNQVSGDAGALSLSSGTVCASKWRDTSNEKEVLSKVVSVSKESDQRVVAVVRNEDP